MVTQAQALMAHTASVTSFITNEKYDHVNHIIEGHGAEGGALWIQAQKLYPDAVWSDAFKHIQFEDGSRILFISAPDSMFETTYKAVKS